MPEPNRELKHAEIIGTPFQETWVCVILLDVRGGRVQRELQGRMRVPKAVLTPNVRQTVRWNFDELREPLCGVSCDASSRGVNLIFPVLSNADVMGKDGKPLSMDDLANLWIRDERLSPILR